MASPETFDMVLGSEYAEHGYPHDIWARWRREDPVHYIEKAGAITIAATGPGEAWLIYVPESFCRQSIHQVRKAAHTFDQKPTPQQAAKLVYIDFSRTGP